MNAISFGIKRAFHATLRVTRKPLRSLGLTAARFDMLTAILRGHECGPWTTQRELRDELDVSSPVISRMLRSLEALGWVIRRRPLDGDKRGREVCLTDAGLECIQNAHKALIRAAMRLMSEAISFGNPRKNAFLNMCYLDDYLGGIREEFGDRARLSYPWHPDD